MTLGVAATANAETPRHDPPPPNVGGPHTMIVGGSPASGSGPLVAFYDDLGYECDGTLIEPAVVLTVEHCVEHPSKTPSGPLELYPNMTARAGRTDRTAGQLRKVASVALPSWKGDEGPELAVVRLDGPMAGVPTAKLGRVKPLWAVDVHG